MKAHQVAAKTTESFDIAGQECVQCGKKLAAPWCRVAHGAKWVCSHNCHELYKYKLQGIDSNVATVRSLTAT